jgi:hypothetical protein
MAALTVTATVTDKTGLTATATATATINDTPPPAGTVWGMTMDQSIGGAGQTWNQSRAVYDSTYGDATHKPIQRSYVSAMPSAGNWGNVVPTDRSAVVSFKTTDTAGVLAGTYDAQLTAFFQATPDPSTGRKYWWTYFHEMEDNFTTAAAKSQFIAGTLNTEAQKQANRASVQASRSRGKGYAIGEFPVGGSKFEDPVNGGDSVRAQWLLDTCTAYRTNGAVFVIAFDTNVGGTFAIESHPTLVSAWRQVVTSF